MFRINHIVIAVLASLVFCRAGAQSTSPAAAENAGFALSRTVPGEWADFTVDNLGNMYLLSTDNRLKKVSPEGDSLAVFNDVRRYGKISYVDATNPLKLLVYYLDFTVILELDRFLNIINTIDLRNQNILQAKAIGLAYDNNIWVYDELDTRLKRVGDDGSLVDQTNDFHTLFDSLPDPTVICDQGGLVYLYDPARGVYVFDHYGTLKTHMPLPGWRDFSVVDKIMLGRDQQKFYRYQLGTLDMREEKIPPAYAGALKIRITPGSIYVLKGAGLEVYSRP